MAHLTVSEQSKVLESIFDTLFGSRNYKRWVFLKAKLNFDTEEDFVEWLLDFIESSQTDDEIIYRSQQLEQNEDIEGEENRRPSRISGDNFINSEKVLEIPQDLPVDQTTGEYSSNDSNPSSMSSVNQNKHVKLTTTNTAIMDYHETSSKHDIYDSDDSSSAVFPETYCENQNIEQTYNIEGSYYDHSVSTSLNTEHVDPTNKSPTTPNFCQICGKPFSHKSNLRAHMKAVHLGVKFGCNLCEQKFTSKQNLKNHCMRKHNTPSPYDSSISSLADSQL